MKLLALPPVRSLAAVWACLFFLLAAGCGHRHAASRPASSLSEKDRALLDQYEQIRVALVDDDLRAARVAASAMSLALRPNDTKEKPSATLNSAAMLAAAPALDRARQIFKLLSASVIPLVDGVEGFYVLTCAMPSCGDWVQRNTIASNPYMGKTLRDYGEVKK